MTVFNLVVFKLIYMPILVQYFELFKFLNSIVNSWTLLFLSFLTMQFVYIKQIIFSNVHSVIGNVYLVQVVINGKLCKLLIEPSKEPKAIYDVGFDECITDEMLPYFRYKTCDNDKIPNILNREKIQLFFSTDDISLCG